MIKEASKIVDLAVEFCRNNLDNLMIYGALIAIFIVIISIVRVSRKSDDEDLDFDEIAYMKQKKEEEYLEAEKASTREELVEVAVVLPPLTARVVEDDEELVPQMVEEAVVETVEDVVAGQPVLQEPALEGIVVEEPVAEQPVVEQPVSRNTSCIEDIIEGLAKLSADSVKKVEIKLQGAEVKITYGDDSSLSIAHGTEPCDKVEELESESCVDTQEEQACEPQEDKEKITEARTYKKFGPENNNVTRSGRIYSEEELEKQIRD